MGKIKFKHVVIGAVAVAGAAKIASMMLEEKRRKDRAMRYLEGEQRLRERALDVSQRSPGTHLYRVRFCKHFGRSVLRDSQTVTATSGDMAARIVEGRFANSSYDYITIESVEQLG